MTLAWSHVNRSLQCWFFAVKLTLQFPLMVAKPSSSEDDGDTDGDGVIVVVAKEREAMWTVGIAVSSPQYTTTHKISPIKMSNTGH